VSRAILVRSLSESIYARRPRNLRKFPYELLNFASIRKTSAGQPNNHPGELRSYDSVPTQEMVEYSDVCR
jgi:hypothetical protein